MIKNNPMNFIKVDYRFKVLRILIIGTLLIFSLFYLLDIPLKTQASPLGVVSFELSGSLEKSEQIMSSWTSMLDYLQLLDLVLIFFLWLFMPQQSAWRA